MNFIDFSPALKPSIEQQREALRKGLGRGMIWADSRQLNEDILLGFCLADQRYDHQVEDDRAIWYWQMIERLNAQARFRDPLFNELKRLTENPQHEYAWDAKQLFKMGCCFAKTGDVEYRSFLYHLIERRPFPRDPDFGERDLMELDGTTAMIELARIRGHQLLDRPWDDGDLYLIEDSVELFGQTATKHGLQNSSDPAVLRFLENWEHQSALIKPRRNEPTRQEKMRAISAAEVIAEAKKEKPPMGLLRSWGIHADETNLNIIFNQIFEATDPKELSCLLRVFGKRELPDFDPRLIQLCQHADPSVRSRAIAVLSSLSEPMIRLFAMEQVEQKKFDGLILFNKNFQAGDEAFILDQLELTSDPGVDHYVLSDIVDLLEHNQTADVSKLAVIVYAMTPCETCRFYATRLLIARNCAPAWLISECQFDSGQKTRKMAALNLEKTDKD